MKRLFLLLCLFAANHCAAATVIWSGKVSSDGTPSPPINLKLHQKYQIIVNGFVNLGKWVQNREQLANDACYEFNKEKNLSQIKSFQNSSEISVCDGKYHSDHIYQSEPFIAKENKIHFWVYDTDYDDNSGAFDVQVIELEMEKSEN